jgi:PAS domain S-box-containing protein
MILPQDFYSRKGRVIILLFLLLVSICSGVSSAAGDQKNVLILNSYHQSFAWTDAQTAGILQSLTQHNLNTEQNKITIEYLDAKNNPGQDYLSYIYDFFKKKYHNQTVDLIITTDDIALQFALKNRSRIFSDAPIVFSGVNQYESLLKEDLYSVTGVIEEIFPEKTLASIFMLFPDTNRIYILYEDTETGHGIADKIRNADEPYSKKAEFIYVTNMSFPEIFSWAPDLPDNSVIISSFTRDRTGEVLDHAQFISKFAPNVTVPVFSMYDMAMGFGAIGGSILSGKEQGYLAGTLASHILSGESADSIPIINTDTTIYTFDYNVLERFQVPLLNIPADSVIINRDPGIFEQYFWYMVLVLSTIAALGFGVIILLFYIRIRKKTEAELRLTIYERNRAEESLSEQFRFLQELMDTIPNPVFIRDKTETYIGCNRAFEDFYGSPKSQILGKTLNELWPEHLASIYLAKDTELFDNPGIQRYEAVVDLHDKSREVIFQKATYTNPGGSVEGIIGVITDISWQKQAVRDLRESEQRFKMLFDENPSIYFIVDEAGSIFSVNEYGARHLGYNPQDLTGKPFFELLHPGDVRIAEENFFQVLTNPTQVFHKELRKLRSDGSILIVHESARAVPQPLGKYMIFIVNEDITERKLTEDALNRANQKLNLLNSVTFNDILNSIFCLSGYVDLLPHTMEGQYDTELITNISEIIQTITKSLDSAKNYQSIGLRPPVWQDVHQSFLFGISHLDMSQLARKVEISDLEVFADPLLETVFQTLADNIIRHAKGATGLIFSYREDHELGIVLILEDDGVGIDDSHKERIFERAYKRTSGLGLFLAREILAITGLSIRETGTFKEGARFEIRVPHDRFRFKKESTSLPDW